MGPELQSHVAFHLTGKIMDAALAAADAGGLRPALLARYRNLTRLRYDFPLVLVAGRSDAECIQSLTAIVNGLLQEVAPREAPGEAMRQHVLRLERAIRALAAEGVRGSLSELWQQAAARLAGDAALEADLKRARTALKVDGDVVDCAPDTPAHLIRHAWQSLQLKKANAFELEVKRLALKLAGILQAEFTRSAAGRSAESLRAAVGSAFTDAFDFQALSGVLECVTGKNPLPPAREQRIRSALAILQSHQASARPDGFDLDLRVFASGGEAMAAFRRELPGIIDLVRAIAVAELEVEGRYDEAIHDPYFAAFDEDSVGAKDLALFPDYLVSAHPARMDSRERAEVLDVLASGMPIKVLVQLDDILEEPSLGRGHAGFLAPGTELARMAVGLTEVYVLQASASHLYRMREQVMTGLACAGPALFSIFSGAGQGTAVPAYLTSASALESRAFPAFTYDPTADGDAAIRLSLEANPQPELDWPVHDFDYEDGARQTIREKTAFTFADFVACDPRYLRHFAIVPPAQCNGTMVATANRLAPGSPDSEKVPYVQLADCDDILRRALIDEKLLAATRRCRDLWRSLQEQAGMRNSQSERLLARERRIWEEQKQQELDALRRAAAGAPAASGGAASSAAAPTVPAVSVTARAAAEATEPEKPPDEASIETPRCTTCNECTNLNNRMFAYNENKQAYIANVEAGTYRELVEAAESCQVSIIHPGRPRNPNEPGLADLLKRAEAFN